MTFALPVPLIRSWRVEMNTVRQIAMAGAVGSLVLLALPLFFGLEWIPLGIAASACFLMLSMVVVRCDSPPVIFFGGAVGLLLCIAAQAGWLRHDPASGAPFSRWGFLAGYIANFAIVCFCSLRTLRATSQAAEQRRQRLAELEANLETSEERLRLLLDSTDAALYDWNPLTETGFFSPRLYEFLGYEPGEVKPGSAETLAHVHPDDRMRVASEWTSTMLGVTSSYDRQYLLRKKDGDFLCVRDRGRVLARDQAGKATRIAGTLCDLSRQRLAEEALRDSEARYHDLVENASDFIFTCDAEGRFAAVNAAMVRQLGYSKEQFLRMQIYDFVQPQFWACVQTHLRLSAGGEPTEPVKAAWSSPAGHRFWVGTSARPIISSTGHAMGIQCIGRDMTQLHDLEEQLRQSQKMEALGRLAGGVAHDFNNLLTVINGFSDLAMNRLDDDNELLHDLQQIWKAGERAAGLTRQLLAFSRKQVVEPRVVDVNEVVSSLEKMLPRVVREDISVELMLSPVPVTVTIDIGHLEQVIMNLVANSRDAMPGGGRLIIRTEKIIVRAQGPLANRGIPVGAHVCLDVIDTGIGMDEKVKARIFDPFFTTKAPGIGTGLGLSTVYGIVQQANGQILVDSQPGSGTTFRVFLAAAGIATALLNVHHRTVRYPAEDGGVILLVEDSQALRELLQLTLTGCGYTVLDAESPHEALRIAESDKVRIDLVITDIVMSGMSGIELGRQLKRQRSDLKVLYMSGYHSEIGAEGLDPSQNFMQKPFGPEALSLRVQQLLATTELLRSSSSQ